VCVCANLIAQCFDRKCFAEMTKRRFHDCTCSSLESTRVPSMSKMKAGKRQKEYGRDRRSINEGQKAPGGALLIGPILFAEFVHEKFFFGMDPGDDGHAHRGR
jgi:hypothetical protein